MTIIILKFAKICKVQLYNQSALLKSYEKWYYLYAFNNLVFIVKRNKPYILKLAPKMFRFEHSSKLIFAGFVKDTVRPENFAEYNWLPIFADPRNLQKLLSAKYFPYF